ncbi:MAG TPA: GyrI-like domain-containing protein [Bacteroidia bacterium]|nr:GyrI-like domain-containing protein [Bacteroidia bacterium]
MQPRFETLSPKKLVGKRLTMSLVNNKTGQLWGSFMPVRGTIANPVTTDLFSMQVYGPDYSFHDFNPHAEFEKWAVVEVTDFNPVPDGMETFTLTGGLYAVFIHKGPASEGERTFRYIFGEWLPSSGYQLDNRPHFELLGEKYKNAHPDSEEEVWIPVRPA